MKNARETHVPCWTPRTMAAKNCRLGRALTTGLRYAPTPSFSARCRIMLASSMIIAANLLSVSGFIFSHALITPSSPQTPKRSAQIKYRNPNYNHTFGICQQSIIFYKGYSLQGYTPTSIHTLQFISLTDLTLTPGTHPLPTASLKSHNLTGNTNAASPRVAKRCDCHSITKSQSYNPTTVNLKP